MTYSPGSPGYQPAQPGGSNAGATPSFAKDEAGESKLPLILNAAVVGFGLLVYILNFFPTFVVSVEIGPGGGRAGDAGTAVVVALLAALLAGLGLLPKAKNYAGIIAVIAVLGALLAVTELVNTPAGFSVGVAMYILVACSILQAFAAAYGLLLDAGVVTAPKPRPKLDPYAQYGQYGQYGQQFGQQYGQYGQQPYYGGQAAQQQHPGPQAHTPQQPTPGYGSQYGGYPQSNAPTQAAIPTTQTGGFGAPSAPQSGPQPAVHQQGTSTPPTGFPSFSPPPAGAGAAESQGGSGPVEHSGQTGEQPPSQEKQSSSPSGPAAPA
jgi:uncharacterized protein DUF5336